MLKKYIKAPVTVSALELNICYYGFPYVQGQLTEVPLNFNIFAIEVVGQTIYPSSTNKMNKFYSKGIFILGLVRFFVLYYSFIADQTFRA